MAEDEIRRYHVPTHLKVNDLLTIAGFTFTFRQLMLLLVGGGAAYSVGTQWSESEVGRAVVNLLGGDAARGMQWCLVGILLVPTLVLAFVRFQGRTLESWCLVWIRYRLQLRRFRWQSQPDPALATGSQVSGTVDREDRSYA